MSGRHEAQQKEAADQQSRILQMISMRRQQQQDDDAKAMNAARMAELKSQTSKRDADALADQRAYDAGRREFADDPDFPEAYQPGEYGKLLQGKRGEKITKERERRVNERAKYDVQVLYPDLYEQFAPLDNDPTNPYDWNKVFTVGQTRANQKFQTEQQGRGFTQQNTNREDSQEYGRAQQQRGFGQQNINREDSQTFAQGQQQRAFDQQNTNREDSQQAALERAAQVKARGGPQGIQTKVGMNRAYSNQIDRAISAVRAKPDAFGLARGVVGGKWGDVLNQWVDPTGQDARGQVADIASALLHLRSGAAVTESEYERMAPFIPQVGDRPEMIITKLQNMQKVANEINVELEKLGQPTMDQRQGVQLPLPGRGGGPASSSAAPSGGIEDRVRAAFGKAGVQMPNAEKKPITREKFLALRKAGFPEADILSNYVVTP